MKHEESYEGDSDDEDRGVSVGEYTEDTFELSDEDIPKGFTPVTQVLDEVHKIVTCLLRLSMTLRNYGRNDPKRQGPANAYFCLTISSTSVTNSQQPPNT